MLSRTSILLSISHIDWSIVWLCKKLLKKEKVWNNEFFFETSILESEEEEMNEEELEAFTEFLNDIEEVVKKHGWNIGLYENFSKDKDFERVEVTFIPAIGYDSQFRKF